MTDKHTDIIRVGIVSSIDPANCTARVTFEDRDDIVTEDFPIIVQKTLRDKYYYMPDVGERVVVLFNPITTSKGFIVGSFYCDTRPIPEDVSLDKPHVNENKAHVTFDDKTVVEYDREKHKMFIEIKEKDDEEELSIEINTESNIKIYCKGDIKIDCEQKIEVNSVDRIDVMSANQINISSDDNMTIRSAKNLKLSAGGRIDILADNDMKLEGSRVDIN